MILRKVCQKLGREITEFWDHQDSLPDDLWSSLDHIAKESGFKGKKVRLLQRIQKIGKETKFSVRDRKLLRKFINKQYEEGKVDFESVLYYFPGKTVQMLKNEYNKKFESSSKRVN